MEEKVIKRVVICFHFSIFEPLETTEEQDYTEQYVL